LKNYILLILFFLPVLAFSQINLKVLDEDGKTVSEAEVTYNNQTYQTDKNGFIRIPLADSEQELKVQKENFKGFSKLIKTSPRSQSINVLFLPAVKENEIQEVVFQKRAKNKTNDLNFVRRRRGKPYQKFTFCKLQCGAELPIYGKRREL